MTARAPVSEIDGPPLASPAGQLLLLALAAAAGAYARTSLGPIQETMQQALALSDNQVALLQGPALAIPMLVLGLPVGLMIDRFARARLLLLFAVLNVLAMLGTAFAPNFSVLFAARCVIGLAATASAVAAFSLLADLYVPAQRGRASMTIVMGQYAGMSAAFWFGGLMLSHFVGDDDAWRRALVWISVPIGLVALTTLAMREPPRSEVKYANPPILSAFSELWRSRGILAPLLSGVIMAEIAIGVTFVWAAPAFARGFGFAADRVGLVMSAGVLLGGVAGSAIGGFLADRAQRHGGSRLVMAWLAVLTLAGSPAGLFAVAPGPLAAIALFILYMTMIGAVLVAAMALLTVVVPNELRGLCFSVSASANLLIGVALAPLLASFISGALGGPTMIGTAMAIVAIVSGLFGAAAFAIGARYLPRGTP